MISERAAEIFAEARTVDPAARDAFVDKACGGDAGLRSEVATLLGAADDSEAYFAQLAGRVSLSAMADDEPLPADKIIGAWRLVRRIGSGGMGAVYLAERADEQFEQQAALKILPTGLDTGDARARFLVERQILARLVHDNIARLLDGGVTDDGLPYFVMDYVDGMPIDEYCRAMGLDVDGRLQLVLSVADAVQYAHRKLVVHRDLKPNNVLVDSQGEVRLLDFGIATVLEPDPGNDRLTRESRRPATPAFASPEMLRGESVDVTTDVYSIGALLYALLAGRAPVSFVGMTLAEMCAHATTAIPPPVSRFEPRAGDELDAIIGRALARLPEERYPTVEALADDLRNYRAGRPVSARRPTPLYRARKFVRRHRIGVSFAGFAAAAVAALVGLALYSAVVSDRQAQQIALERDRAERTRDFLVSIFESTDPNVAPGEQTVRSIREGARARIEDALAGQPEVQADLLQAMGSVYQNWRLTAEGRDVMQRELELREALGGAESDEYADTLIGLAYITEIGGDYESSIQYARRALEIYERHGDRMGQAAAHERTGRVLHLQGDYDGARRHFDRGLELVDSAVGPDSIEASYLTEHIANLLNHQEQYEESLAEFRRTLSVRRKHVTDDSSEISALYLGMGAVLAKLARFDEATDAYEQGLAMNARLFGPDNSYRLYFVNGLGKVAEQRGAINEARAHFVEARSLILRDMPQSPNLAFATANVARTMMQLGQYEDARSLYREAEEIFATRLPRHWALGTVRTQLGLCLVEAAEYAEAEALILDGIAILERQWGADHHEVQAARDVAITLYETWEKPALAAAYRRAE